MIRRLVTVAAVAAVVLAPIAAARAADQPATKPAKLHHMTAQVASVDATAKTLTVKRRLRPEVTFTVAPQAAGSLADLKPGERVRITYERSHGTLTAESITPLTHAAAK